MKFQWYRCPVCGNEHFIKIRPDTVIIRYPAYCKPCKNEILVNIEPGAETVNLECIDCFGSSYVAS